MCETNGLCHDNGNGRCDTPGHGGLKSLFAISKDGLCKVGRKAKAQMINCPVCGRSMNRGEGLVFNFQGLKLVESLRPKSDLAAAYKVIKNEYSITEPICSDCAAEVGKGIFVSATALAEEVVKFVKGFLAGEFVYHKHQPIDGKMRNWCDFCGCLVALEEEDNTVGVVRGNIASCLCPQCGQMAHKAISDLPQTTYFKALEQAMGRPIVRTIEPKPIEPTRPSVPSKPETSKPRFATVKDVYDAIEVKKFVRWGEAVSYRVQSCVTHANAPHLCSGGGAVSWDVLDGTVHMNKKQHKMAVGWCKNCSAALVAAGVDPEKITTFERAMIEIGVLQPRDKSTGHTSNDGAGSGYPRGGKVEMDFTNSLAKRRRKNGRTNKSSGKSEERVSKNDPRSKAKALFDERLAKLGDLIRIQVAFRNEAQDLVQAAEPSEVEHFRAEVKKAEDEIARLQGQVELTRINGYQAFLPKKDKKSEDGKKCQGGKRHENRAAA